MGSWHDWQAMGGAIVAKETRDTSLEAWQERIDTFRLRAERGLEVSDAVVAIERLLTLHQYGEPLDTGALLIEVMTIARLQRHDLAHGLKQAFARLEREYEAGQR